MNAEAPVYEKESIEETLRKKAAMAAHTQGPWKTGKTAEYKADEVTDAIGERIAQCSARGCSTPETEANARLISAAPELLAALQALIGIEIKDHTLLSRLQFSDEGRKLG